VHPFLPRTDLAALVEIVAVVVVGVPLWAVLVRRGAREAAWLVGGLVVFALGFFGLRSLH
jgi:hypothetical protein